MTESAAPGTTQQYWEDFYQERDQIWTGNPNPLLVREVDALTPGTALDLGCGEGADAVWLATRGWRVTAVDVSPTALGRAAAHAEEAGVRDRLDFAEHDLTQSFPQGTFDLVSAQFFHSPVEKADERIRVLRQAADAVAPNGVLLIAGHAGWPSFDGDSDHHADQEHDRPDVHFPTMDEVLEGLGTTPQEWRIDTADQVEREVTWPDGRVGIRADTVLRLHRLK